MDSKLLHKFEKTQLKTDLPAIEIGDTVTVTYKIKERGKERLQSFTGIVISEGNRGVAKVITVRKVTLGVGVEKIFPIHSPFIDSIAVKKHGKIRRAKLYYMRGRIGKKATKIRGRKDREKSTRAKES
jgi:large subunit ribosomal protein L19